MPTNDNWQAEALADAARFAARHKAAAIPPGDPLPQDLEDAVQEGERCSDCGWSLQAGTIYCANCGSNQFEDEDEADPSISPASAEPAPANIEDSAVPSAHATAEQTCSECEWVLQDESTFCGNCGRRLKADEPHSEDTMSLTAQPRVRGNASLFSWMRDRR